MKDRMQWERQTWEVSGAVDKVGREEGDLGQGEWASSRGIHFGQRRVCRVRQVLGVIRWVPETSLCNAQSTVTFMNQQLFILTSPSHHHHQTLAQPPFSLHLQTTTISNRPSIRYHHQFS